MMWLFLAIGFVAGAVAQVMNFPITYDDYQHSAHDWHKRREFYKDVAIDFFLTELFFIAVAVLLALGLQQLLNSV